MEKIRWSNIELCRIIAILCVMLVHTTFSCLGHNVSFGVMLLAGFSIIGVDVFVMLSGYFTATPKKSSLINLAFICLFWMIIRLVFRYSFDEEITWKYAFFITKSNWFIPSYICLLFFAPVLNVFCSIVKKNTLLGVIIALVIVETWFDWIPPGPDIPLGMSGGHSVLSFLTLYLIARYIRIYDIPSIFKRLSLYIYIACSFLLGLFGSFLVRHGLENQVGWVFADNNPIVIISSISFIMIFERKKFQSRLINYVAKSVLACLLGHSAIYFIWTKQFKFLYDNFSGIQVVGYWALAISIVFVASITIDQLRILLYKPIEILFNKKIKNDLFFELPDLKATTDNNK